MKKEQVVSETKRKISVCQCVAEDFPIHQIIESNQGVALIEFCEPVFVVKEAGLHADILLLECWRILWD